MQPKILILFSIIMVILNFSIYEAAGHGIGYEVLPPQNLGERLVSLEVVSSGYQNPETPEREITFSLFDINTGISLKDVTFQIIAEKGNKFLFEDSFETDNGIFVLKLIPSNSGTISIEKTSQGGFFGSLIGIEQDVYLIKGTDFNSGGLYNFNVKILTAESYSNKLKDPLEYQVGLSIPDRTFYEINDPYFGIQQLAVITYYDLIDDFNYEPLSQSISFKMPFEWSEDNINQTSVVHEEIIIPKTFGDLLVSSFSVRINGLELPDYVLTIDDFFEEERIIHLVINQIDLLDLNSKQEPGTEEMSFLLLPSSSDLPLSTVTDNGQFTISLDWEPEDIKTGTETEFIFNITDVFLRNTPVSVDYELFFKNNEKEIFKINGKSTDSKEKRNEVNVFIPAEVSGIVEVQFENLSGNEFARAEFPIVVDRDSVSQDKILIPDWVRNNAGWWSDGLISDREFASGIEFMIVKGIIQVPTTENINNDESVSIPDWVRNNAGWWSDGLISDGEFASGLQFLMGAGIISL